MPSWMTRLLLLVLLGCSPGASPAFWIDAVQYITSVMIYLTKFSHDAETLILCFDDTFVAGVERPVDQVLTRLYTSEIHIAPTVAVRQMINPLMSILKP